MSSDNESPAVVELPDDAIEALVQAAEHAYEYMPYDEMAEHAWPNVVRAVYPLIAARVRAEALREAAEKIAPNQVRPSNVIVVGARMTEDVLDLVRTVEDALVAAVRAEAVAEQPAATRSASQAEPLPEAVRDQVLAWVDGAPPFTEGLDLLRQIVTPVPGMPTVLEEAVAGERQRIALAVDRLLRNPPRGSVEELYPALMAVIAAAGSVPVATRLQPGRVGFGTDAFEVGGSLPGEPVATPTEPEPLCEECCDGKHQRCPEQPGCCCARRLDAASLVPAGQPEER